MPPMTNSMGGEPSMNMNNQPMDNSMMNDPNMTDNNIDMGNDDIPMDNEMPMDNNENMSSENNSNDIQSMAGKLANALRGTDNVNDKKFAAGMINAAAVEGLSSEDTNDILKKIKSDEDPEMENNNEMPMGEQKIVLTKQQVNEIKKRLNKKS